jgi:hypothetical protein
MSGEFEPAARAEDGQAVPLDGKSPVTAVASGHTPGEWRLTVTERGAFTIEDERGRILCQRCDWSHNHVEAVANAHLFHAAPDLLRALRMFENAACTICLGDCAGANPPVVFCPLVMMRDAIAKATGSGSRNPPTPRQGEAELAPSTERSEDHLNHPPVSA